MPANAEPLLLPAEVNAYSTSERPCGPTLSAVALLPVAIAAAVPISTSAGVTRKYSEANLISRAPIFLPRYSGVRPTISPATNTVITASTSMPYRPEPTPPGATSPSIMLTIGIMPPSAVYESWNEFTAPVEVSVVAAAKVAEFEHAEPDLLALHRRADRLRHRAAAGQLEHVGQRDAARRPGSPITATIA